MVIGVRPNPGQRRLALLATTLATASLAGPPLAAEPFEVLFIRGTERSGGFLEGGGDAAKTEQLADINNASTAGGNHGWFELADLLRANNFNVSQAIEPLLPSDPATGQTEGGPLNFTNPAGPNYVDLGAYDAVVFGSNNATYDASAADAVEAYVRGGGGVVFISDANFGDDWRDASDSDQPFASRFGLTMNQDRGRYAINANEYLNPDHPILDGVQAFDGEGVTPITVDTTLPAGVDATILALAQGQVGRNVPPFNAGNNDRGPSSPATPLDAALVALTADQGRVVGYFDRNTFFNENGAGTHLTREITGTPSDAGQAIDNDELALNLFNWVAQVPEPGTLTLLPFAAAALLTRRR